MELYTTVAYQLSRKLTLRYSTSFGTSSRLFDKQLQQHIFAIYGLVRVADEIVDSYRGPNAEALLTQLEAETAAATHSGFSTNPIVHTFACTAKQFGIGSELIAPFFDSMRMDLAPSEYHADEYQRYIYGSAEVVGLMCLRVFLGGDAAAYDQLQQGARALGAAYQKINFLRDMASDYEELSRVYFPGVNFETFSAADKQSIIADIMTDFAVAEPAIKQLPRSSRSAVRLSYRYYAELLRRLDHASVETIVSARVRVPAATKIRLLLTTLVTRGFNR